jgi:uncharacterized protein (DUF1499 family)
MHRLRPRRDVAAALLAAGLLLAPAAGLFAGSRPQDLGFQDGRLAPCRPTPNCVSSFADPVADPGHHVAALRPRGDAAAGLAALADWIAATERVAIVRRDAEYLRAEYTSRVLGFVDDLELALDRASNVIQVRSASRVGRSDFGVNRARVEALRVKLAESGL